MAKKPVSDQMELFEDGGFKDQGKTKDPVSKNPVPVGSTQEEVRDDIPANLSEGEFVLPADVVRYHGLEKIMGIRDQAKQGLQKMENMGQMGNSDQATLPDGVPFTQMAEGGVVPGVNIQGPTTQLTKPSMFAAPAQPQPVQVSQPVTVQTPQAPVYASSQAQKNPYTFEQAIGTPFGQQQKSETRVFVNEAGEKLYIPFVNGQSIYPVPAGYTQESVSEKEKEQEQTVTDVRARSATTQQDSGGDDNVGIKTTAVSEIAKAESAKGGGGIAEFGKFLASPVMYIAGKAFGDSTAKGKFMSDQEKIDEQADIAGTGAGAPQDPASILEANSQKAFQTDIRNSTAMFGAAPTFTFGNEAGNVDIVSNGVFHINGLAMNADGEASLTEQGTVSYKSAADFAKHMSASYSSGWHGSTVSTNEYGKLGQVGKERYDAWAEELGYKTGGGTKKASVERDDRFKSGEDFSDNKKTNTPTTTLTTTPTGVTQGSTIAKGTTGYPDVSQGSTIATTSKDPRVVDPSDFAKGVGQGSISEYFSKLTSPTIERPSVDSIASRVVRDNIEKMKRDNVEKNITQEVVKTGESKKTQMPTYTSPTYNYDYYDGGNDNNDSGADSNDSNSSDMGFSTASGGFIQRKNLPKANKKKMKQGGLASRK